MKTELRSLVRTALSVLSILLCQIAYSQNSVGIGIKDPNPNAVLELVSPGNNQGILVPRLTSAQRTDSGFSGNLSALDEGLLVFDTDADGFYYWNGSAWSLVDSPETLQDLELSGSTLKITNNPSATNISLAPFLGTNTDEQTLALTGVNLSITNGNSIDLSPIQDGFEPNTDDQILSLSGTNLSIAGGNTIDISSIDTDTQLSEVVVDAFVANNGFLTSEIDGSITNEIQNISTSGTAGNISIAGGATLNLNVNDADASVNNEIQDLNLTGNILTITNNASATPIDLSPFSGTNTDNQTISLSGTNLSITGGNTIDISSIDTDTDTDDQTLNLTGTTLSIVDGNSVNLSSVNTDNQTLGLSGSTLSIAGGNNVNLSSIDTDDQALSLSGTNLSIAGGNTIDISSIDTNTQLSEGAVDAFVANNGFLTTEVDGSVSNEIQNISTSGAAGNISISTGATLNLNVNDADASTTNEIQDLTFSADVIALSNDPGNTLIDLSGYDTNAADDFNGDFAALSNIPVGLTDGDDVGITSVSSNSTLVGDGNSTQLGVNVGTAANQIVQLNVSGQLPAVNGSLLTGLPTSPWTGSPNISYSGGNVGIGTSSPFSQLTLSGNNAPGAVFNEGVFLDVHNTQGSANHMAGIRFKVNAVAANQRFNTAIFNRLDNTNQGELNFAIQPNAIENVSVADIKMTLRENGNFGIGTTVPEGPLHVVEAVADVTGVDGAYLDIQNSNDNQASLSGIRLKNNSSVSATAYKAGIVFERGGMDANSGGSGDLVFAINSDDNLANFTIADERFSVSSAGASVTGQLNVSNSLSVSQSSSLSGDVSVGGRLTVSNEFSAGVSGVGIAGYLLQSNGSSTAPTWTPNLWDVTFGSVDDVYFSSSIGPARLGLGTTTPSTFLDIQHGNVLTPALEINATATFNEEASIRYITADNTFTAGVNDVGSFIIKDGASVTNVGSERLSISNTGIIRLTGFVGIGIVPNVALDVAGSIEYTGTITDVSDRRLKKNIKTLDNSLDRIIQVHGVSFEMKDEALGRGKELGVIAQELEKVFPELVFEDEEGFKSVNYIGLIAPLVEAIKEQQSIIESQSGQIEKLKNEISSYQNEETQFYTTIEEMRNDLQQIKRILNLEAINENVK